MLMMSSFSTAQRENRSLYLEDILKSVLLSLNYYNLIFNACFQRTDVQTPIGASSQNRGTESPVLTYLQTDVVSVTDYPGTSAHALDMEKQQNKRISKTTQENQLPRVQVERDRPALPSWPCAV